MRFAKGHGTGNDFVILPDPDGRLDLPPHLVAALCDRHRGLGADGVLRVVRSAAAGDPAARAAAGAGAEWFMDYRNADGSVAEMCGNGLRVFARYLLDNGLATTADLVIGTRAGLRAVAPAHEGAPGSVDFDGERHGWLTAAMGPAALAGTATAVLGGRRLDGLAISVGNPHLACLVDEPLAAFDLDGPPEVDPGAFPDGVNVEIIRLAGDHHVEMRVHERGSGVTLSCGTGAVATAVGAAVAAGEWPAGPEREWIVDVPGGRLAVTPSATASLLAGPAVIVATGELDPRWLAAAAAGRAPAALSVSAESGIG